MKNIDLNSAGSARVVALRTRTFFNRIAKAALLSLSAVLIPAAAFAQSEARVCVHVPDGTDFDSGYAPFVLVLRDTSFWNSTEDKPGRSVGDNAFLNESHIALPVNFDNHKIDPVNVRKSFGDVQVRVSMDFGYNCNRITLGVGGQGFVKKFDLQNHPFVDAVTYGSDDFCADEVYIQRYENGQLIGTRRYMNNDQKCWGNDLSGAEWFHKLAGSPVTDLPPSAPPAKIAVDVNGQWKQQCTSGNSCSMTTEKEYTFSKAFSKGYTNEVQTSIEASVSNSTTVSAEVEAGPAKASASNTLTTSLTTGLTNAVTQARETSDGSSEGLKQSFTCPLTVPVGKLGYLWESTVKVGPNTATILHCLDACSTGVPNWQPGENITSCNTTPAQDEAAKAAKN